jgi:RNA polymerase sigma-70 factor, ECF subfamily
VGVSKNPDLGALTNVVPKARRPDAAENGAKPDFAHVFEAHQEYVWRSLRYLGVAEADLEDVAQDVFVMVYERLADFRGDSTVSTWIYGIAVNHARAWRRKGTRREQPVEMLPEKAAPGEQAAIALRRRLLAALDAIDDDKRAVFVLHELEQRSMEEVAHIVGCGLFTAYARHRAARKKLAELLEDER